MSQIYDVPDNSTFGLEFDYAVWAPGTVATLCRVPWDSSYRDVVFYDNVDDAIRDITSDSASVDITGLTYASQMRPVRVNIPFSVANKYNYLVVRNPAMPIRHENTPNVFFYFINNVDYVAPNTTSLSIQLDVWQTYCHEIKFGNSYITRGHIGIAAENAYDAYGAKYLTTPEGFDLGTDYMNGYIDCVDFPFTHVVIVSSVLLNDDYGDVGNPKMKAALGTTAERLPHGCDIYYAKISSYLRLRNDLSNYPWISQGIISVTAAPSGTFRKSELIPVPGRPDFWRVSADATGIAPSNVYSSVVASQDVHDLVQANVDVAGGGSTLAEDDVFREGRDVFTLPRTTPGRYSHLKKFCVHPYSEIEVTMYLGTPIVIKPETLQSKHLILSCFEHSTPPAPRIMFTINNMNSAHKVYNSPSSIDIAYEGDFLDRALSIANLPSFSLTNDAYRLYMANNANQLNYAYRSAEWSQQKAQQAASTAQSIANMNTFKSNEAAEAGRQGAIRANDISTGLMQDQATLSIANTAIGGLGAVASRDVGGALSAAIGAATTGISTGMNVNAANLQSANAYHTSHAQQKAQNDAANYSTSANYALANFAARGDYANAIAGIQARTQDAELLPPTISGQVGGEAFVLAATGWRIYTKTKIIAPSSIRMIGEYWLRYGYSMSVWHRIPDNFQVMTHFTYWQTQETVINSATCPEMFRQTIRGIFEKGVTVWNRKDDIGNIDTAVNKPLGGVVLS